MFQHRKKRQIQQLSFFIRPFVPWHSWQQKMACSAPFVSSLFLCRLVALKLSSCLDYHTRVADVLLCLLFGKKHGFGLDDTKSCALLWWCKTLVPLLLSPFLSLSIYFLTFFLSLSGSLCSFVWLKSTWGGRVKCHLCDLCCQVKHSVEFGPRLCEAWRS